MENNCVARSGKTHDYRGPDHFSQLSASVRDAGIEMGFRILGVLPLEDVVPLMWTSVAAVNPSLFEGRSTTVEEAKSLGDPTMILDIAVHREQNPEKSHFFDPNDAEQLATILEAANTERSEGPRDVLESTARRLLPQRTRTDAENSAEAVAIACQFCRVSTLRRKVRWSLSSFRS